MIEANIRNLSRIELLYSCVSRAVKYHYENHTGMDLSGLEHYTDPDDKNLVIYHSRHIDVDIRTAAIIHDAEILLDRCQGRYGHVKEHQLLLRCSGEDQTVIDNGKRRLRIKARRITETDISFKTRQTRSYLQRQGWKEAHRLCGKYCGGCQRWRFRHWDYQYEQKTSILILASLAITLTSCHPQEIPALLTDGWRIFRTMHRCRGRKECDN